jgi:hypothetical protein
LHRANPINLSELVIIRAKLPLNPPIDFFRCSVCFAIASATAAARATSSSFGPIFQIDIGLSRQSVMPEHQIYSNNLISTLGAYN